MSEVAKFYQIDHGKGVIPSQEKAGDAGYDLRSIEDCVVRYGEVTLVHTGVSVKLGEGKIGLVCPRSGLAAKHGITVVNAPGIIDNGYDGEIIVVLSKLTPGEYHVRTLDKIAQLVVAKAEVATGGGSRGANGFGSTGR